MKINELMKDTFVLQSAINELLKKSSYLDADDFSSKYDYPSTADEFFIHSELRSIFEKLEDIEYKIDYLKKPIKASGYLALNSDGRYELKGKTYTSGSSIEFKHYDDCEECYKWVVSRVESTNGQYYIVGYDNIDMTNIEVRHR